MRSTSGLYALNQDRPPERGARIARREERADWASVSDEERGEAGCPARPLVLIQRIQVTSGRSTCVSGISGEHDRAVTVRGSGRRKEGCGGNARTGTGPRPVPVLLGRLCAVTAASPWQRSRPPEASRRAGGSLRPA